MNSTILIFDHTKYDQNTLERVDLIVCIIHTFWRIIFSVWKFQKIKKSWKQGLFQLTLKIYVKSIYIRLSSNMALFSIKMEKNKISFQVKLRKFEINQLKIYSHKNNISSNQLFSNFIMHLVKALFSRNFWQKRREINWRRITVWKNEKFSLTEIFFRQINYLVISLVKPLLSQNFC